ncbi:MAG TPA: MFS transporter [Sphingomonas sp.]|nr:MFS transporter [Sphingomonas sp.]
MTVIAALADARGRGTFVLGSMAVTAGVALHLPMFLASRSMAYRMAGMAMDVGMLGGMALIVGGVAVAAYGLLPTDLARQRAAADMIVVTPAEDAPLTRAHVLLMAVLVVALVIDVMKPASLGFTVPGMVAEYRVAPQRVALVPFFALAGTVVGSILWGAIADVYGRKASIMLSAVMFVGTSICGAMPSLAWNIGMCFMMGAAAGGMLPVTFALLAEMMPRRHRGWSLVLVGGLGAGGGYFAASGCSALLQPLFGWRILWLLNLPTGLLLIALGALIPESAKFLLARGRSDQAQAVMRRFGAQARSLPSPAAASTAAQPVDLLTGYALVGKVTALSLTALAWGFVNFGLLLWLPTYLVARGFSVSISSRMLALSSIIAIPTIFIAALLYSRWSSKWSLVTSLAVTLAGIAGVVRLGWNGGSPVLPVALLIVGSNGVIAMLLPYATESFPLHVRARATGWVAACSKAGGLVAQSLGILALVPALATAAIAIAVPMTVALLLVMRFGRETRGRELRTIDPLSSVPAGG